MTPSEEKLTRWIDGDLSDAEVAEFLKAFPEAADEKDEALQLGNLVRSEIDADTTPPYPDFFNSQISKRIRDEDSAEDRMAAPEKESVLSKLRWLWAIPAAAAVVVAGMMMQSSATENGSVIISTFSPSQEIRVEQEYIDGTAVITLDGIEELSADYEINAGTFTASTSDLPGVYPVTVYSPETQMGGIVLAGIPALPDSWKFE